MECPFSSSAKEEGAMPQFLFLWTLGNANHQIPPMGCLRWLAGAKAGTEASIKDHLDAGLLTGPQVIAL